MTDIARAADSRDVDEYDWPLGLSEQTWRASQDLLLPGGLHAFGLPYHAQTSYFHRATKTWRPSPFLPRGIFDALAFQRHLTGEHIVGLVWPGLVNCVELDIDRKRWNVASWESVLDRLVLFYRALDLLPAQRTPELISTSTIVEYGEWIDELAEGRRLLIENWPELPGILWRSSSRGWKDGSIYPGGARLRLPLDGYQPKDLVRERFTPVLDAAFPGWDQPGAEWSVEMWPHGEKNCRLPGSRGSDLLRIEDGRPMTGREVDKPQRPRLEVGSDGERILSAVRTDLHRALGAFITEWAARAERVLSLPPPRKAPVLILEGKDTQGTPPNTSSSERRDCARSAPAAARAKRGPGSYSVPPIPHGSRLLSPTANLPPPIAGPEERDDRYFRLVCGWYVGAGLSRNDTAERATAWVLQPGHGGSLGGRNGATVARQMIATLPKMLDLLDRKVAEGKLTPGARSRSDKPRASTPTLAVLFDGPHTSPSLRSYAPCFADRDRWRDVALAYVTAADKLAVSRLEDPWPKRPKDHPKLLVFVGLLRLLETAWLLEDRAGPFDRVRVPWFVAKAVAPMRRLPAHHPAHFDEFGAPRSPYKYLLVTAQTAGFLGRRIVHGQKGITSTIYEVLSVASSEGVLPFEY
jgi:hypothetical protein